MAVFLATDTASGAVSNGRSGSTPAVPSRSGEVVSLGVVYERLLSNRAPRVNSSMEPIAAGSSRRGSRLSPRSPLRAPHDGGRGLGLPRWVARSVVAAELLAECPRPRPRQGRPDRPDADPRAVS